jgi:RNA polymerase sigma-70 factor (ECF subfamily)
MSEPLQFEAFMRDYQDMVFTTAWRLVGREADAEDIAQEVFLKAYEHFEELVGSPTAGGWLKTVARNLAINHLNRYRSRWRFFSDLSGTEDADADPRDFVAELPAETPDVGAGLDQADRRELLERALQKLPPAQRVPIVLYHFENLGYEEIARRLGVSLGKIKTDIHRGREALRRRLRLVPELATACPSRV